MNNETERLIKADYATYEWVMQRHLTSDLVEMTDAELAKHEAQCHQIDAQNDAKYAQAEAERRSALATFRRDYPRAKVPRALARANIAPPSFTEKFETLKKRRDKAIRTWVQEQSAKKDTFLDRMNEGKLKAKHNRYQRAVNKVSLIGIALGIQFESRQLDDRLDELLTHFIGKPSTEVIDE